MSKYLWFVAIWCAACLFVWNIAPRDYDTPRDFVGYDLAQEIGQSMELRK